MCPLCLDGLVTLKNDFQFSHLQKDLRAKERQLNKLLLQFTFLFRDLNCLALSRATVLTKCNLN